MTNTINESKRQKPAVLFMCGGINEISTQFVVMLQYCRRKNLKVVDFFFETSGIARDNKACYDELMAYIRYVKEKTAVVFYDNNNFHKYADTNDFLRFTATKQIELHLAKNHIILGDQS